MKYYIGVDGGGTKTAFLLGSEEGQRKELLTKGCSYQMIGVEGTVRLLADGIRKLLNVVGAENSQCGGCCMGVPCYGENREKDALIVDGLRQELGEIPFHLVNDVEIAWAGALNGRPGIHLVAGTGAIAFGVGEDGHSARCGGWNEFFGDEGSCYWVGREAMSLFTKEADGREEKGELYELVRRKEGFLEDVEFIDLAIRELIPYRDRVAAFQIYASQASLAGDMAAVRIYERAAGELALLAGALKKRLLLPAGAPVTCSGGLFQNGELIFGALRRELERQDLRLERAERSAAEGALLLAEKQFGRDSS